MSTIGIDPDIWSVLTATDSTATNRTGIGRTLDHWLSRGGRRLGSTISALVGGRPGSAGTNGDEYGVAGPSPTGLLPAAGHVLDGIDPDAWTVATGSNSTISGLPGAGRTIDNFLSQGGRPLEAVVGSMAHKLGFGPTALVSRLLAPSNTDFAQWTPCDDVSCKARKINAQEGFPRLTNSELFESCWDRLLDHFRGFHCLRCRGQYALVITSYNSANARWTDVNGLLMSDNISVRLHGIWYIAALSCFHPVFADKFVEIGSARIVGMLAKEPIMSGRNELIVISARQAAHCLSATHRRALEALDKVTMDINGPSKRLPPAQEIPNELREPLATAIRGVFAHMKAPDAVPLGMYFAGRSDSMRSLFEYPDTVPSKDVVEMFWFQLGTSQNPFECRGLVGIVTKFYSGGQVDPQYAWDNLWIPLFRARLLFPDAFIRHGQELHEGVALACIQWFAPRYRPALSLNHRISPERWWELRLLLQEHRIAMNWNYGKVLQPSDKGGMDDRTVLSQVLCYVKSSQVGVWCQRVLWEASTAGDSAGRGSIEHALGE